MERIIPSLCHAYNDNVLSTIKFPVQTSTLAITAIFMSQDKCLNSMVNGFM